MANSDAPSIFDAIRFDPDREHGVVTPPDRGAHYSQDGFHFGSDHKLAKEWLTDADEAKLVKRAARAEADRAAEAARVKMLRKLGVDPEDETGDDPAKTGQSAPPAVAGPVDFVAWATAEKKYLWQDVQKAFRDRHQRDFTSSEDALDFLVEEQIVGPADVKL